MAHFLLDTHALIWIIYSPEKLPAALLRELEDPSSQVSFSSVCAIEIAVKISVGKLKLDLVRLLEECSKAEIEEAPFRSEYAKQMIKLPPIHSDPFDRAIIAQSIEENTVLVTCDAVIQKYSIKTRWE